MKLTSFGSVTAAAAAVRFGIVAVSMGAFLTGCLQQQGAGPLAPPANVDKYVDGAKAYRAGNNEEAIAKLEAATSANPHLITARSLLGDLYKERGDYSKAADQYAAVTELDPYTAHNFYKLGVAQHLLQKLNDASTSYSHAIKLDPKDWESHMNLGLVDLARGKKDDAIGHMTQATLIDPGSGAAFGNLAIALDAAGRLPEAEAAYKRALELDPNDTASLGNLGKNLMRQKKSDQAVAVLKSLADMTESASARKLYGDALVQAHRHDDAIQQYQGILKDDKKYYPAFNGIASAMIGKYEQSLQVDDKQKAGAIDAWKQSLALNPQQPKVEEQLKKWQP